MSKVSGVLRFVRCHDSSNVRSRGQVPIFVKRHCAGVNLVEEGYGPPGVATQVHPACRRCYLYFSIDRLQVQSGSECPQAAPSPPVQSEFPDRDAKQELYTRVEGEPIFCMQLP